MLLRSTYTRCVLQIQKHTYRTMTATKMAANAGQEPISKQAKIECAEPKLLVKKLSENATLPVRGSARAAGYDLARFVPLTSSGWPGFDP